MENRNVEDQNDFVPLNELKPCAISVQKIEQIKQDVRCHHSAMDLDTNFYHAKVKVIETDTSIKTEHISEPGMSSSKINV